MRAFREINDQRRQNVKTLWLPEELVCQIETYLRAMADMPGISELQSQEEEEEKDHKHRYAISDFLESTA